MEILTIKKGSFERIKESTGLELDILSLLIHKSSFWHYAHNEINNTKQETTHNEDRILGAGSPLQWALYYEAQ